MARMVGQAGVVRVFDKLSRRVISWLSWVTRSGRRAAREWQVHHEAAHGSDSLTQPMACRRRRSGERERVRGDAA